MLRQQRLGMCFPVSQKVSSLLPQICMATTHSHMKQTSDMRI